ncbi:MAG: PKD domain-containing protein [Thermodesulfobacteriota bacterium]|nr:PKD domain-containing protein [Thermodesulfobacteriota bacterium]
MMKRFSCSLPIIFFIALTQMVSTCSAVSLEGMIIDHTCTDLSKIPTYWLEQAKELTLHYAHTSHGSQVTSGITNLESLDSQYSVAIRQSATEGLPLVEDPPALRIYDGNPPETYIGPEDYWNGEAGKDQTRAVANTGHYDLSMWSWCGQVSSASESYINDYLDTMDDFESEYPGMRFIYMTGHLNGSGLSGNLHIRNEQIRNYCITNNKVLFDFADIERYNPDGNDFLDLGANDNCDYSAGNWADQWCAAHPGSDLCDSCSCAHSRSLNCNLKGRAFWWMMARLAGWNPSGIEVDFTASPRVGTSPFTVAFSGQATGDVTSWLWDFGDGGTSGLQNPSHEYVTVDCNQIYTVSLAVTGSGGGSGTETKVGYVTVNPLPVADFTTSRRRGRVPLTIDFTDRSAGAPSNWSWLFGDGQSSLEASPSHTYDSTGTYTVILEVSNDCGSDTETKAGYVSVTEKAAMPWSSLLVE